MNTFYKSLTKEEFKSVYYNESTPSQTNLLDIGEYYSKIESILNNIIQIRKSLIRQWHFQIYNISGTLINCQIEIYHLIDEYWIVSIGIPCTHFLTDSSRRDISSDWKHYLCDQWDGLVKCLNDLNLLK